MTRDEFLESICDYDDLIIFCNEHGIVFGEVLNENEYSNSVDEDIIAAIRCGSWEDLRDCLNECPSYSDSGYYKRSGELEYEALSDYDFDCDKEYVLEIAENHNIIVDENGETKRERLAREAAEEESRQRESDEAICADLMEFIGENVA